MTFKIKPLTDRIVIKQESADTKTAGGLLLPPSAQAAQPRGEVLAIGPKVETLKVGDTVVMTGKWYQDFKLDGVDYIIINEPDVIGVVVDA